MLQSVDESHKTEKIEKEENPPESPKSWSVNSFPAPSSPRNHRPSLSPRKGPSPSFSSSSSSETTTTGEEVRLFPLGNVNSESTGPKLSPRESGEESGGGNDKYSTKNGNCIKINTIIPSNANGESDTTRKTSNGGGGGGGGSGWTTGSSGEGWSTSKVFAKKSEVLIDESGMVWN